MHLALVFSTANGFYARCDALYQSTLASNIRRKTYLVSSKKAATSSLNVGKTRQARNFYFCSFCSLLLTTFWKTVFARHTIRFLIPYFRFQQNLQLQHFLYNCTIVIGTSCFNDNYVIELRARNSIVLLVLCNWSSNALLVHFWNK